MTSLTLFHLQDLQANTLQRVHTVWRCIHAYPRGIDRLNTSERALCTWRQKLWATAHCIAVMHAVQHGGVCVQTFPPGVHRPWPSSHSVSRASRVHMCVNNSIFAPSWVSHLSVHVHINEYPSALANFLFSYIVAAYFMVIDVYSVETVPCKRG